VLGTVAAMLAARAVALRDFDSLPDDALIGYPELALIDGRNETALRQAKAVGRLRIPAVRQQERRVRFRVGDVRKYLRGELEVA
jgi:hypothetical protein